MYPGIDPTIHLNGTVCEILHLLELTDIRRIRNGFTTPRINFTRQFIQGGQRSSGNDNLCPALCKLQSRLPSDAAVGTDDDNYLFLDWF
jgi:hypothetical protein